LHIATFYKSFSLEPRGEHLVRVCLGTACHVRNGPKILEAAAQYLGIRSGETTPDMKFTLESVNCLGCCALGPVMIVDNEYHGKLTSSQVSDILSNYRIGELTMTKEQQKLAPIALKQPPARPM
ncbi:MAG: NAD(P)H-dependent oxidoreductase subunit E, partial [Thermoplasmata archaeon]|nr:NAD(P)H-dependent oxidoreductase subunit E [Thermoplasmata archaeon]